MTLSFIALQAVLFRPGIAFGATIYADPGLTGDCAGTYNPTTRSCGSGSAVAYRTIQGAASAAQAGDTVLLRQGTFGEILTPPRSGTAGSVITFKSHDGETATISGVGSPAISLLNRNYLVIEGLTVNNVTGWGRIESSANNIIRNNRFVKATSTGTTGGLKFVKSTGNKVLGNTFEDGNDSLVIQESDRNLVQGNTFTKARHSLLSVRCGNYNVFRGNRFHNTDQKAAEIYDCEGTSDAPVKLDATKHNLFESNKFTYTLASGSDYYYNGIQYCGQLGIVRNNEFYDNQGGALSIQVYSDEALYNYGHRIYNNTFYANRCYGMSSSSNSAPDRYYGTVAKNNLFYKNLDCGGGATQVRIGNTTAVKMENNAVQTSSPLFADETARDLRLAAGSPMIDAGIFATKTAGAGSGSTMTVEDVGYFYDGFGIPGETGDQIQLEGQTAVARIVAIDFANRTLSLDGSLTWTSGQNVHIRYSGQRPDMGANEYASGGTPRTPYPPTNLRVAQ